jgi:hypothetical protein
MDMTTVIVGQDEVSINLPIPLTKQHHLLIIVLAGELW